LPGCAWRGHGPDTAGNAAIIPLRIMFVIKVFIFYFMIIFLPCFTSRFCQDNSHWDRAGQYDGKQHDAI